MTTVYLLLGTCLLLSICALTVAWYALRACGRSLSRKRMDLLEMELGETVARLDDLRVSVKRVASREHMRDVRAKRHPQQSEDPPEFEDPDVVRTRAKTSTRKALGVPENPVSAVLANLRGEIRRERR